MVQTIARPSVASLLLQPAFQGQVLGTATGFVVEHGDSSFLLTNWHVVAGRRPDDGAVLSPTGGVPDEIQILHNQAGPLGQWVIKTEPLYDAAGAPRWKEHPQHARAVDAVALELTDLSGVDTYAYDPWASGPGVLLAVAGPLSIVGFPFGISGGGGLGVWVQGTIATEPTLEYGGLPCFLIDSRTRSGQSGSPVVFYSSGGAVPMADGGTAVFGGPVEQLRGIYSGRISDQSDLGFVWNTSAIRDVVANGVAGQV